MHVGVRHHQVELLRAGVGRHAVGAAVAVRRFDPPDGCREPELAPDLLVELHESADERARCPAREEDAPVPLEVVDEGVDGARLEGVPAHEERVEAQRLAQVVVLDEALDGAVDRAVGPQANEVGGHLHHVREAQERHAGQLLVALDEDLPRVRDEGAVASDVARREPPDLLLHVLLVAVVVEGDAVGPGQAVEGSHRQHLDVVGHPPAGHREELLEALGRGDDGGAGVERVALVPVDVGAAPGEVALLEENGADAAGLEPDGGGEPAEAAPDDGGAVA